MEESGTAGSGHVTAHVPVIAIGSSADGFQSLRTIIAGLPATLRAAVIIVQHIAPARPSLLPDLFRPISRLRVKNASDGEPLVAGTVYFATAGLHLSIEDGTIRVEYGPKVTYARPSVDVLMTSVARVCGKQSIGVVLSGMSADGAIGLTEIRNAGGATIVQDPREAKYGFMPKSALALDGHRVLPLAAIPAELSRLVGLIAGSGGRVDQPVAGGTTADVESDPGRDDGPSSAPGAISSDNTTAGTTR